jgi:hypothetical protein
MENIFTITLTDAEKKALEYVSLTADGWIQNAVHERCRIAIEEMVAQEISNKISTGQPINGSKEEIVMASTLPNAAERHNAAVAQAMAGPVSGSTVSTTSSA